jgi:hypothetical protein
LGVVHATQALLELAGGDWLYLGAADDYALPGFFEQAMAMAQQHPQAAIISGKVVMVSPEGQEISVAESSRWHAALYATPEVFLREHMDAGPCGPSLVCATLWRRDALLEVGGFRENLGHWSDTFALRSMALKYGACYVPERWAAYRAMPDSFFRRQNQDHCLMLQLVGNAVAPMRSQEFRDRWPEDHVSRWQKASERAIFEDWAWRRRERFGYTGWGLWMGRLYTRYLLLQAAAFHGGDLGAFIRSRSH